MFWPAENDWDLIFSGWMCEILAIQLPRIVNNIPTSSLKDVQSIGRFIWCQPMHQLSIFPIKGGCMRIKCVVMVKKAPYMLEQRGFFHEVKYGRRPAQLLNRIWCHTTLWEGKNYFWDAKWELHQIWRLSIRLIFYLRLHFTQFECHYNPPEL